MEEFSWASGLKLRTHWRALRILGSRTHLPCKALSTLAAPPAAMRPRRRGSPSAPHLARFVGKVV
eukprot:2866128-Prorocentrum_lima.AAC.1